MKKAIVSFVVSACIVFSLVGAERGVVLQEGVLEEFYRKKTEQTPRYHSAIFEKVLPLVQAVCGYVPSPDSERDSRPSFCLNKLENAHEIIQQFENVRLEIQIDSEKTEFARFSFQLMEKLILLLERFMKTADPEILYKNVKCFCLICAYLFRLSAREGVVEIARLHERVAKIKNLIDGLRRNCHFYYDAYFNALQVKISLCWEPTNTRRVDWICRNHETFSCAFDDQDFFVFLSKEFNLFTEPRFLPLFKDALKKCWDIEPTTKKYHQYLLEELKKASNIECVCFDILPLLKEYRAKFEREHVYKIVRYARIAGNCVASAWQRCCSRGRRRQTAR